MADQSDSFAFTPVPGRRHRLDARAQRKFIAALARTGLVAVAAREVGVSVAALNKLRYAEGGETFRAAWDAARACPSAQGGRRAARAAPSRLRCASTRPSRRTSRAAFTADPPEPGDPLLDFPPFIHPRPRRNSITPARQSEFIAQLAATGSVTQAALSIGASLEALYRLRARKGAEGFAAAWERAIDAGIARLEDSALARAIEGEARPIVARGEVVGEWRRHNEALVMFLLRQRRAGRYGDLSARLKPGDPLYEKLKEQWRREAHGDEAEVIASINAKIDLMRARMAAGEALIAEGAPGDEGED